MLELFLLLCISAFLVWWSPGFSPCPLPISSFPQVQSQVLKQQLMSPFCHGVAEQGTADLFQVLVVGLGPCHPIPPGPQLHIIWLPRGQLEVASFPSGGIQMLALGLPHFPPSLSHRTQARCPHPPTDHSPKPGRQLHPLVCTSFPLLVHGDVYLVLKPGCVCF